MVHPALQPERATPQRRSRDVGHEGVARRRAEPLTDPVHDPEPDHLPGRGGEADQRSHHDGDGVPEHDQGPPPCRPVGEPPRAELHERRRELRGAVQRAQRFRSPAQHPGDEGGEQRVDHLARKVVEQR